MSDYQIVGRYPVHGWVVALCTALPLLVGLTITAHAAAGADAPSAAPVPAPAPALDPVAAVRVQVEALAYNDLPFPDAGIRVTWAFASPGNRLATGPLDRFSTLFENPAYAPMVNNRGGRYSESRRVGGIALVGVVLASDDGRERGYLFQLSRQDTAACAGCWMTDSVAPVPVADAGGPAGPAI